jgi:hypothetical protein
MRFAFLNKHRKGFILCLSIFVIALFVYLANYIIITKPLRDELAGKAFEFVQTSNTAFVLPKQYQDNTEAVPETIVAQMKSTYKTYLDANLVENSNLANQEYEVCCQLIDIQISHNSETIISNESKLVSLGKIWIEDDQASVQLNVHLIETKIYSRDFYRLFTIGFVRIEGQWKIITVDYNFAEFEENP